MEGFLKELSADYDVIVVGAGHAGCEAAVAAARTGSKTLLITSDMNRIAQMSCNPAIGGVAKGQIVREIDALGGMTGIVTDLTSIQFRMLNRSKGAAVWSPRAQVDRTKYIDTWRRVLDSIDGLYLYQDTVTRLIIDESGEVPAVNGVETEMGMRFSAGAVVLTNGTFLNGKMHFGSVKKAGGRISEEASYGLTEQLQGLGFETGRMKTGTPARIDGRTIDYSQTECQHGDDIVLKSEENVGVAPELNFMRSERDMVERDFHKFSFLPEINRTLPPRDCYIVHTNAEGHDILRSNLDKSPLYNGDIQSIGPRYCPSIETKIVTFADKESHQLFLEPEGENTVEFYINGFSSSLPADVQMRALRMIPALRNVHFYRPGYAIEYDYFPPTQLMASLETKLVEKLYFAGQINGTTGYEEAAGQGLMAGLNASRRIQGLPPVILGRDTSYIGVLIDDLVTKGVDEPYRMFTSRAEYRIILRQDDADVRLTPIGFQAGLASQHRMDLMEEKKRLRDELVEWCKSHNLKMGDEVNKALTTAGTSPLSASQRFSVLLRRPQLGMWALAEISSSLKRQIEKIPEARRNEIVEAAEIIIKYEGYIEREKEEAEKMRRLERVRIPEGFDYERMTSISTEARQKLSRLRPMTIGQASRIPGVSPSDISILLVRFGR